MAEEKDEKNTEEESTEEASSEETVDDTDSLAKRLEEKDAELRKAQFTIHKLKDSKKEGGEEGQGGDVKDVVRQTLAEDYMEETLSELADSDEERELIKNIYSKRLNPSGYTRQAIRQDLQTAKTIANQNLEGETEKAAESKNLRTSGANSSVRKSTASMPKLSEKEQKLVDRYNLTPEQVKEALANT